MALRIRARRVLGISLMALIPRVLACTAHESQTDQVLDLLSDKHPCRPELPSAIPVDSALTDQEACSLVALGIDALGSVAPDMARPVPADTALVTATSVISMSEVTPRGDAVGSWWVITYTLSGRDYDVDVRVDQSDGSVQVFAVHK